MESPRRKSARNEAPACPICGRCFPADEIEAHAAECAARAFGEEEGLGHISGSIHAVVSNQSACRLDLDAPTTHKEKVDLALTCSQAQ